ncbi:MAG: hypothetical protein AB7V14_00355 [Kiritimatiellia bacterium]
MLQRKLALMIAAMAGAGLLGMIAVYLICGTVSGDRVGLGAVFCPSRPALEDAGKPPAEIDGVRNKILAGGCTGIWIGLAFAAFAARPRNNA